MEAKSHKVFEYNCSNCSNYIPLKPEHGKELTYKDVIKNTKPSCKIPGKHKRWDSLGCPTHSNRK